MAQCPSCGSLVLEETRETEMTEEAWLTYKNSFQEMPEWWQDHRENRARHWERKPLVGPAVRMVTFSKEFYHCEKCGFRWESDNPPGLIEWLLQQYKKK